MFHTRAVAVFEDHAAVPPLGQIRVGGFVQLHGAASAALRVDVAAADHVGAPSLAEQEGIAPLVHLQRAVILQRDHRIARVLLPDDQLVIGRQGHPLFRIALADARVEQARPAVGSGDRSAGEHVLLALFQRGPQRDRQVLPVHQVAAARVPPVHVAPRGSVRVELVEEVVPALIEDGAVGIVVPVGRRMEMVDRTVGVGLGLPDGRGHRLHRLPHSGLSLRAWERCAGRECACCADAGKSAAGQIGRCHGASVNHYYTPAPLARGCGIRNNTARCT